jgi:hypothetical protein
VDCTLAGIFSDFGWFLSNTGTNIFKNANAFLAIQTILTTGGMTNEN